MNKSNFAVFWIVSLIVGFDCTASFAQNQNADRQQQQQRRRQEMNRQRQQQGGNRGQDGLKVGELAPTFKLKSLDGKSETDLATFRNQKPVILFFGSYT